MLLKKILHKILHKAALINLGTPTILLKLFNTRSPVVSRVHKPTPLTTPPHQSKTNPNNWQLLPANRTRHGKGPILTQIFVWSMG